MKIIEDMFIKEKLRFNEGRVESSSGQPIYIGITKMCCKGCISTILAINSLSREGTPVIESIEGARGGMKLGELMQTVQVRGAHLREFPLEEPGFIKLHPIIKEIAEGISRTASRVVGSQYPKDSSSSDGTPPRAPRGSGSRLKESVRRSQSL